LGRNEETILLIKQINQMSSSILRQTTGGKLGSEEKRIEININDLIEEHPATLTTNPLANIDTDKMLRQQHSTRVLEVSSGAGGRSDNEVPFEIPFLTYEEYKKKNSATLHIPKTDLTEPDFPFATKENIRFHHRKCFEVMRLFWQTCQPLVTQENSRKAGKLVNLMKQLRQEAVEWTKGATSEDSKRFVNMMDHIFGAFDHAAKVLEEARSNPTKKSRK
jgi:hypothetical protein